MGVVQTETGFKFKWVVTKISQLKANRVYSEEFIVYGQIWQLLIYPKGDGEDDYLALYLVAVLPSSLVDGWSRHQKFSLSVINQLESFHTKEKNFDHHFTAVKPGWGTRLFLRLSELKGPAKGFLVNDACVVEAKFELMTDIMNRNTKIVLKLLVDKKHDRVVLAEADKDFVDIILSILTMPLGRIQNLLNKDLSIGCISNLWDSVKNIDHLYFKTDACKNMLLNPMSEADQHCQNLMVNINSSNLCNYIYTCREQNCFTNSTCYYSYVPDVSCTCGGKLSKHLELSKLASEEVFVKEKSKFIITDDLHIIPASTSLTLSLLAKLGNDDQSFLEERILDVGHKEVLNLLRDALSSNSPLTKLCFGNFGKKARKFKSNKVPETEIWEDLKSNKVPKTEIGEELKSNKVEVKLLLTKSYNKIVHMEGDEEMANLMFSFLTLPLGSVVKLLNKSTSLGCIDNIYNSAESLCLQGNDYIKSEDCKMMLLNPKLAPFFGCTNQILSIDEAASYEENTKSGCYHCFYSKTTCIHDVKKATLKGLNPKCLNNDLEKGGGYAEKAYNFIVTNDLQISPFSAIAVVGSANKLKVAIGDLVEKKIMIGKLEALNLLKAALVSKTPLDDAFTSNYNKKEKTLKGSHKRSFYRDSIYKLSNCFKGD